MAVQLGGLFGFSWSSRSPLQGHLQSHGADEISLPIQTIGIQNTLFPNNFSPSFSGTISGDNFAQIINSELAANIYFFRAERLNIGECLTYGNCVLSPDASNLAEVLNLLISSNSFRYQRFVDHVRAIFTHITNITVPSLGNSQVKIMVWSCPSEIERDDLAVPLAESGTGVGQILAMLYIIVTSDSPKIIIIDEPQSFLHPGAVRKLFDILRMYPQHQYIVTTHSPTAIAATGAESLIRVYRHGHESLAETISTDNQEDLYKFLNEVGARLSDVFGFDEILWVEGKTEEVCFPEIIKQMQNSLLSGLQILAVQHTGDLEGKIAPRIFEIYNRLSLASTLLPPYIAFILDREDKNPQQQEAINQKSLGKVHWLPRMMYENYLLHSASIAQIISEDDQEREKEISVQEIEKWIDQNSTNKKYFGKDAKPTYPSTDWYSQLHGANFLKDLFSELTQQRVVYDKVRHGLRLTKLVVQIPTPEMQELNEFLKNVLEKASGRS